jgi:hypothetical protein
LHMGRQLCRLHWLAFPGLSLDLASRLELGEVAIRILLNCLANLCASLSCCFIMGPQTG